MLLKKHNLKIKTIVVFFVAAMLLVGNGCKNETPKEKNKSVKTQTKEETKHTFNAPKYFDAALNGDLNYIHKSISNGTPVDITNDQQNTALMLSAFNGHTELVLFLLKKGANINRANVNNRTALMFASSGPFDNTVKELINAGAEINTVDNVEQFTALMFAASEGQNKNVEILLDKGADKTMVDKDGDNAYTFALANGHKSTAELLK